MALAHLESIIRLKVVIFFACNSTFSSHIRNIKPVIENETRLDMKECSKIVWNILPHWRIVQIFSNRYFFLNFAIYFVWFSTKVQIYFIHFPESQMNCTKSFFFWISILYLFRLLWCFTYIFHVKFSTFLLMCCSHIRILEIISAANLNLILMNIHR